MARVPSGHRGRLGPRHARRRGHLQTLSRRHLRDSTALRSRGRRTRKSRRGYLGVWLDWKASKKRESFDTFQARALKETDSGDGIDDGNFSWVLGNKKERDGVTNGVCRKNGTVQKEPLRTLSQYRKVDNAVLFGTNVVCLNEGEITVGDELVF